MIHFPEDAKYSEVFNACNLDKFRSIMPETALKKENAMSFWDDEFKTREILLDAETYDQLVASVFNWAETAFVFDYEVGDSVKKTLERFSNTSWAIMPDSEKVSSLKELGKAIADMLGLSHIPGIEYFKTNDGTLGDYSPQTDTIRLNPSISEPKEIIKTLAHEIRHAYQHNRAEILETWEDVLYKVNFDNYISPIPLADGSYLFFTDYQDQLVEAEARAFSKWFTEACDEQYY